MKYKSKIVHTWIHVHLKFHLGSCFSAKEPPYSFLKAAEAQGLDGLQFSICKRQRVIRLQPFYRLGILVVKIT